MPHLAIVGGQPVRTTPFPVWPVRAAAEENAVLQVLRDGVWGVGSPVTQQFEREFAACAGARFGVSCVNGTAALMIALFAAGVEDGQEVIVPPYTFIATAIAPLFVNAVPVFADVDAETFNLDPAAAAAAVTPRTRAVIPVHFAGVPASMTDFNRLARKSGLAVIEDACHAHGAEYRGRRCGSLGDLAAFSFQSSKNLCSGEGGFISTNNERLGDLARAMSHVGRLKKAAWYEHAVPGGNFRLSALQSALLLAQLKRLERQTTRRDANGRYLAAKLSLIEGLHPQKLGSATTRCSHHLFMFRLDPAVFPVPRDKFVQALRAEGIPCSGGYGVPLNRQPVFLQKHFAPFSPAARKRRDVNYARQRFPVAERLCAESVWFTQSMLLGSRKDMNDIVRAVRKVRDHAGELR